LLRARYKYNNKSPWTSSGCTRGWIFNVAKLSLIQERPPGKAVFSCRYRKLSAIDLVQRVQPDTQTYGRRGYALSQHCWRPSWTVSCRDVMQPSVTTQSTEYPS